MFLIIILFIFNIIQKYLNVIPVCDEYILYIQDRTDRFPSHVGVLLAWLRTLFARLSIWCNLSYYSAEEISAHLRNLAYTSLTEPKEK